MNIKLTAMIDLSLLRKFGEYDKKIFDSLHFLKIRFKTRTYRMQVR